MCLTSLNLWHVLVQYFSASLSNLRVPRYNFKNQIDSFSPHFLLFFNFSVNSSLSLFQSNVFFFKFYTFLFIFNYYIRFNSFHLHHFFKQPTTWFSSKNSQLLNLTFPVKLKTNWDHVLKKIFESCTRST